VLASIGAGIYSLVAQDQPTPTPTAPKPEKTPAPAPEALQPAESDKEPEALTEYKGRIIAKTMHFSGAPWLQRETRENEERASVMREALELKSGQTVCDLGCGDGYHTLWMAEKVGSQGKVYAVDVQKEMLQMLGRRLAEKKLENVEMIEGKFWDPLLPEARMDLILLVDVYHEFSHPEPMLTAIRKALKPDGKLVLVEFRTEDQKVPIKPEHKMSKEQMGKEIPPMGFKLVREFDELPWQHMMFYQRTD
jgi:ubiquinone/menaquinone biosynthesis C-methylase UbiE